MILFFCHKYTNFNSLVVQKNGDFLKTLAKIVNFSIFQDKITIEQCNNLLLEFGKNA